MANRYSWELWEILEPLVLEVGSLRPPPEEEGDWDSYLTHIDVLEEEYFGNEDVLNAIKMVGQEAAKEGGFPMMMKALSDFRRMAEVELGDKPHLAYYPDHLAESISALWSGIGGWQR